MKKLISKIKGLVCRIRQTDIVDSKEDEEIYCYGNDECENCCGFKTCECSNKLINKLIINNAKI